MEKKTILAIDMSAIFYMAHHATADAPLSEAKKITLETIGRIQRLVSADATVVCCDSKTNWRKTLDPTYKAQREKQPATFYGEMQRVKDRLMADGLLLFECDGYEADDVIATLCNWSLGSVYQVVIASPDKDLLQLVRPELDTAWVKQLRTHDMLMPDGQTPKLWDEAAVTEYLGVPPTKVADYLAIVGDKADNITGIDGVGGKGAAALLAEYGNLEMVITNYESNSEAPFERKVLSKWKKPLVAYFATVGSVDKLRANRVLTGLKTDAPIDVTQIFAERKVQSLSNETESGELDAVAETKSEVVHDAVPTQTRAIAVNAALSEFDSELQPNGMSGAYWLAKRAVDARLYTRFATPEAALMVMLRGKDYGLTPAASLEMLHVIEGKVSPPSQLIQAMAKRSPQCEYFAVKEATATSATIVTKRKGTPFEEYVTYTIDQAKTAGLMKPGGAWFKNPEDMLVARAAAKLARRVYPDATTGAYAQEEFND